MEAIPEAETNQQKASRHKHKREESGTYIKSTRAVLTNKFSRSSIE
jgi:hypothetical protein